MTAERSREYKAGIDNKITDCLDKMSDVDTYAERYSILWDFSQVAFEAGGKSAFKLIRKHAEANRAVKESEKATVQ
jgi:hypothetical protein